MRFFAIIAASLLCFRTAPAATLDQSHVIQPDPSVAAYGRVHQAVDWAQTFTVGLAGRLDRVDLQVFRDVTEPSPTVPLRVEIRGTSAGIPAATDAAVLASATLAPESVPLDAAGLPKPVQLTAVDLSASNLNVSPGEVLAIVLRSGTANPGYEWQFQPTPGNGYAGGVKFLQTRPPATGFNAEHPDTDFGFQTYVTVPEPPAALWLAAAGTLGLARVGRRG